MTEKKTVSISDNTTINISMKMLILILGIFFTVMTSVFTINRSQHQIMEQRLSLLEIRMSSIEQKLDMILKMSGIDPNSEEIKDYIYAMNHKDEAIQTISDDIAVFIQDNIANFQILLIRPREDIEIIKTKK